MQSVGSGGAPPAVDATKRPRQQLEYAKRTDNFLSAVGPGAIWAMDAPALAHASNALSIELTTATPGVPTKQW